MKPCLIHDNLDRSSRRAGRATSSAQHSLCVKIDKLSGLHPGGTESPVMFSVEEFVPCGTRARYEACVLVLS